MDNIRNFSIIAHVDHGKSTLADRILEKVGAIEEREMKDQILDSMDLERERGITIKMRPVFINYKHKGKDYILNFIDTPGHIDFSYEVSRSLRAVEGVLLLVDATQGVQAQTLSVLQFAKDLKLKIIPVLSKIDSNNADIDRVSEEVISLIGCKKEDIMLTSGKTGAGVEELLEKVVEEIPSPTEENKDDSALIFDFLYTNHNGIVAFARIFKGEFNKNETLKFLGINKTFNLKDIGIFTPAQKSTGKLSSGMIGYFVTGIKEPGVALVGDTLAKLNTKAELFSGYENPSPVIWASLYPQDANNYNTLLKSLKELRLSDASLFFEEENSSVLGKGFRCGFLGMLHLEIIVERLKRESNLELIITSPSTDFLIHKKNGEKQVITTPAQFPDQHEIDYVEEPWVKLSIISPSEYIGVISKLLSEFEGVLLEINDFEGTRSAIVAEMPLRELMRKFFDSLKSLTAGYASLSYERIGFRIANVARLDILLAEEIFPAFSSIVSITKSETEARALVSSIFDILPRALFIIKIQAKINGKIIASKTLSALRKDVTAKLYGGDITRKMKLREKQKKGKSKRQSHSKVNISHDIFLKIMKKKNT